MNRVYSLNFSMQNHSPPLCLVTCQRCRWSPLSNVDIRSMPRFTKGSNSRKLIKTFENLSIHFLHRSPKLE